MYTGDSGVHQSFVIVGVSIEKKSHEREIIFLFLCIIRKLCQFGNQSSLMLRIDNKLLSNALPRTGLLPD